MTEPLNILIEALREELRQYGEMLARLDAQQDCISRRASDEVVGSVASIQAQAGVLRNARQAREDSQRLLSESLQVPADTALGQIAPRLPSHCRPLLRALLTKTINSSRESSSERGRTICCCGGRWT